MSRLTSWFAAAFLAAGSSALAQAPVAAGDPVVVNPPR